MTDEITPVESTEEGTGVSSEPEIQAAPEAQADDAPADNSIRAQIERAFERDEKGRFKPGTTPKQVSDQSAVKAAEPARPAIQLPKSWSADQAERFSALPPELQEYLTKRESEREAFLNQKSERASRYDRWEPIERELSQLAPQLRAMGIEPNQAFVPLLKAQMELASNPVQALQKIAKSYGISLGQIQAPQGQYDPSIRAAINQEIAPIRDFLQQQAAAQTESQLRGIQAEISKFSEGKEHWDKVSRHMLSLIPAIQAEGGNLSNAQILDRAYNAAVALSPEVKAIEAQKAEAKRVEEAKAKVAQARKAGASISSSASSQSTAPQFGKDLRSTLEAAFDGKL